MFTQEDVHIIAAELPSNAIEEIAHKAGVSRATTYRFFQGLKVRQHNQERIYLAALKVIEKDKARTKKIREERARILNKTA